MRGHVPLRGDIRIAQAGFLTSFHSLFTALQRGFPFDFLFLSDWMECSFDLLSIKVKLKYPLITNVSVHYSRFIAVDHSRLIFIDALH